MAQRRKPKTNKRSTRTSSPRRVVARKSPGRKRVSERRFTLPTEHDYTQPHGVTVSMPDPKLWKFREELNSATELRFYFERLPRQRLPVRLVFSSLTVDVYIPLRDFAASLLGQYTMEQQPGVEGRFRGMPALVIDQNITSLKLGYRRDLPTHQRVIFFRKGRRLCYFDLRSPALDFTAHLDDLDEVLKGIEVN